MGVSRDPPVEGRRVGVGGAKVDGRPEGGRAGWIEVGQVSRGVVPRGVVGPGWRRRGGGRGPELPARWPSVPPQRPHTPHIHLIPPHPQPTAAAHKVHRPPVLPSLLNCPNTAPSVPCSDLYLLCAFVLFKK